MFQHYELPRKCLHRETSLSVMIVEVNVLPSTRDVHIGLGLGDTQHVVENIHYDIYGFQSRGLAALQHNRYEQEPTFVRFFHAGHTPASARQNSAKHSATDPSIGRDMRLETN